LSAPFEKKREKKTSLERKARKILHDHNKIGRGGKKRIKEGPSFRTANKNRRGQKTSGEAKKQT